MSLLLISPLLLLLIIELLLRAVGTGYPSTLFLPWQKSGTNLWVSNAQFTRRFFPMALAPQARAFAFPAQKETDTTRVFILGESAALGEPEPKFGFGVMLRALLRERFPTRHFEIINLGIVAINSHVIREIAKESASRQGDLWIVYMGNNEMVGPFGAVTVMGSQAPSLGLARASLALKKTRIGQLLDAAMQDLRPVDPASAEWHGMASFSEQRIRHDDSRTKQVHSNFAQNLQEILEAVCSSKAPVLLCTVGTNLKDCPPFASLHRPGIAEDELSAWQAEFEKGKAAEAAAKIQEAFESYSKAAKIDETHADLQFRMARCLNVLGKTEEARRCYENARDYDALQFRADRTINETIRRLATQHSSRGVRLIDLETILSQQTPAGIAGTELFFEHVHLNPEGNYLIARTLAREVENAIGHQLPDTLKGGHETTNGTASATADWLSQSECFAAIGLHSMNRLELLSTIQKLVSGPPFNPADNSAQLQKLKQEIESLRPTSKPGGVRMIIPRLRQALERRPEDTDLRAVLADALEHISDYAAAESEWKVITDLLPQSAVAFCKLGYAQEQQGRLKDALDSYRTCVLRQPNYSLGQERLGLLLAKEGFYQEASPHLRAAIRTRPGALEIRVRLGKTLLAVGKNSAAAKEFQEVLKFDPSNIEALQALQDAKLGR